MNKQIGIHFGALSDDIKDQLTAQEFKFDAETIEHFQQDADAITRLRIRGLLVDSQASNALGKLHKKIVSHVSKQNKLKVVAHGQ